MLVGSTPTLSTMARKLKVIFVAPYDSSGAVDLPEDCCQVVSVEDSKYPEPGRIRKVTYVTY